MKKLLLSLAVIAMIAVSCNDNKKAMEKAKADSINKADSIAKAEAAMKGKGKKK
jgi:hypothetical protein